jgi:Mrp family chromosome partitioning ATPase
MPDRALDEALGTNGEFDSLEAEEFLPEWESVSFSLSGQAEECVVPAQSRLVMHSEPTSAAADRFRLAQIRLKNLQSARKLKSLLITSPLPGDGKTTVALNLAAALAENGRVPVLLIEADVHRPTILGRLGLKPWAGLTECFRRREDPMLAIRRINPLGFYLLPAGQPSDDGSSVLRSAFVSQLVKGFASSSVRWVLIDAPPTVPVADVLTLNAHADATLLVARAGATPREAIEESIRQLGQDHIVGIILNCIEGLDRMYSRYYGYGKSGAPSGPAKRPAGQGLGLDENAK